MAWVVKPSGTMEIERREEPYFTEALRELAETDLKKRYPTAQALTLPLLHEIQHLHNWIPFQAIEELAEYLGLEASEIWDTATFYEEFFLQPKGKYLIQVCQSISCELCGQLDIMDAIEDYLGVVEHETTEDDRFTFLTAECLGSCGTAPVLLINGVRYENLSPAQTIELLKSLPEDPHDFGHHAGHDDHAEEESVTEAPAAEAGDASPAVDAGEPTA